MEPIAKSANVLHRLMTLQPPPPHILPIQVLLGSMTLYAGAIVSLKLEASTLLRTIALTIFLVVFVSTVLYEKSIPRLGRLLHYSLIVLTFLILNFGFHDPKDFSETSFTHFQSFFVYYLYSTTTFFVSFSLFLLKMKLVEFIPSIVMVLASFAVRLTSEEGMWHNPTILRAFLLCCIFIFCSLIGYSSFQLSYSQLQEAQTKLAALSKALEEKVQERTQELLDSERAAERTLAASNKVVSTLFSVMPAYYYKLNARTRKYIYISDGIERVIGRSPETFMGDDTKIILGDLMHPDDAAEVTSLLHQFISNSSDPIHKRVRLKHINGEYRKLVTWAAHLEINEESGDPIVYGFSMDETDLIDARLSKAVSDAANTAKSHFLATMSHDLRTPLNSIVGMASMLNESKTLDVEEKEMVSSIWNSSLMLLDMVKSVLNLSKIESNDLISHSDCVEIRDVLQTVESTTATVGGMQDVALIVKPVPHDVVTVIHQIDVTHLKQVLLNLIGNAFKFTPVGGSVTVSVSMSSTNELQVASQETEDVPHMLFEVEDTGPGIAKEQQDDIFKAFFQSQDYSLPSSSSNELGVGLGLAICKQLVESFGGHLGLRSELGEGATFWFTIPLRDCDLDDCPATHRQKDKTPIDPIRSVPKPPAARAHMSPSSPRHVLIVDDNDVNRRVAEMMVKKIGCTCEAATNGQDAVDTVQSAAEPFDLVLMDIQMPVLDGLEAMKKIRKWESNQNHPRTRIVALTAMATTEDVAQCEEAGADGYLSKPVTLERLKETVLMPEDEADQVPAPHA